MPRWLPCWLETNREYGDRQDDWDGGLSHNGPLLGTSESMSGGTSGTNPHQQPPSVWQVSRC
jgi:hypothetical protein